MSHTTPKKLVGLHQALHTLALNEAKQHWGYQAQPIINYETSFHAALPSQLEESNYTDLLRTLAQNHVVLFGDFHTFKTSQATFLDIIQKQLNYDPSRSIAIGLEMSRDVDQTAIDAFLRNDIDESEFLKKISYYKYWGFPWENFKPIFDFARRYRLRIFGINAKSGRNLEITQRDTHSAQCIAEQLQQYPNTLICCLIGEYHLASSHLPREINTLNSNLKTLSVFHNTDHYTTYEFHSNSTQARVWRLQDQNFCIINAAPWLKWQSLNQCGNHTGETSDDFDIDYHFFSLAKMLNDFFDLDLSDDHLKQFRSMTHKSSANSHLHEAVGQFLHLSTRPDPATPTSPAKAFYLRVLQHAAGIISAKVLNPYQEFQTFANIQQHLKAVNQQHLRGYAKQRRLAAREALRHQDWLQRRISIHQRKFGKAPEVAYMNDQHLNFEISRCVGEITGSHLFELYMEHRLSDKAIASILFRLDNTNLETLWNKITAAFLHASSTQVLPKVA